MPRSDTSLVTIYWRDIPAQVLAKKRRDSIKVELEDRFSIAIDQAAMRAGLVGTDAYLEQWRRVSEPCGDDLETAAHEAAKRLETDYDMERLKQLIQNEGNEPVA